uniref:H15 domain-containing protein n=1 Tax=Oryzias melastigma TaxID=30732 RepID=A0A3B3DGE2_ORYME
MCGGSLPQNDGESRQKWCVDPLSSTAAGAVGAVLCPGGGTECGEPFFNFFLQSGGTKKDSTKLALPEVSKVIHGVVSQCKRRGSISMAQLKQTLAAEGYDVTKSNRQVKATTIRLVKRETFVRTTRSASLRLNKKILTDKRRNPVKSPKPKEEKMTLRSRGQTQKPKGKTHTGASGSNNQRGKTPKPEQKQASKLRKTAIKVQKHAKIKAAQAKKTLRKRKLYR